MAHPIIKPNLVEHPSPTSTLTLNATAVEALRTLLQEGDTCPERVLCKLWGLLLL